MSKIAWEITWKVAVMRPMRRLGMWSVSCRFCDKVADRVDDTNEAFDSLNHFDACVWLKAYQFTQELKKRGIGPDTQPTDAPTLREIVW